ncbi:MAG: glycosyltransferase family 9 protein [Acidobacteriia bacterium]|nr:glycosyltransferase family 9 protein [Terriglobia bacterium]
MAANSLNALPRGSRVAIIRLRSLGDCVLTTPALDILKRFRPDLRVGVVVEDRFREVFAGNPDIDAILAPRLRALRQFQPQLCLNFHGGPRSAWMTALSGARLRAGSGHYRNQFAYNIRIPRAQEVLGISRKVHTAEHLASAMFYLGVPQCDVPRAKLIPAGAGSLVRSWHTQVGPLLDGRGSEQPYAVLHPFATHPLKAWPVDRFAEVARRLRASSMEIVVIGGPADDLSPFRDFRALAAAPLPEVMGLLAGASLFAGNDSGPAHMAAAFGVPSVVLFGSSDPEIWGPWRAPAEVIASPDGIEAIATSQVLAALARLGVPA